MSQQFRVATPADVPGLAARSGELPPTELSQALADGMLAGGEPDDDLCVLVAAPAPGRP